MKIIRYFIPLLLCLAHPVNAYVNLSGAWFGNGGYKIAQQDIWPQGTCSTCTISANWDATNIKMAGFKNEMIGGMLWLQGGSSDATSVRVELSPLTNGSSVISSTAVLCAAATDYTTREFEIFVATYVQVIGMTQNSWETPPFEERDVPPRFQNPFTVNGNNQGAATAPTIWSNRPDSNKFFPDALIPQECKSTFTVFKSSSQGVWIDVYLKKTLAIGLYTGTLKVFEGATVSTTIPVQITVYNGSLPDQPAFNYIADVSEDDINYRLNGIAHNAGCSTAICQATDKEFYKTLHRHRIIPIGDSPDVSTNQYPSVKYQSMLDGTLFSAANGYAGPGVNTGIPIYSIGTYATWSRNANWSTTDSAQFCVAVSSWGYFFKTNFPNVRSFVYLADEPVDLTPTKRWSTWMATMTACQNTGYTVHSWVTSDWVNFPSSATYVDMPASTDWINKYGWPQANWQTAANTYCTIGSSQCWAYNGHPSWQGSVNATEDDGVSAWEGSWADYKKGVNGHFQWQTTSWYNPGNQNPPENPLWTQARTFGFDAFPSTQTALGHFGFNFSNGDGMLLYPGTEVSTYTVANLGFLGPVVSLRMKLLRRGINDYDYLAKANRVSPTTTASIVASLVPSALWDISCFDPADCSYSYGGRLWTADPNSWEVARAQLANLGTDSTQSEALNGKIAVKGTAIFK